MIMRNKKIPIILGAIILAIAAWGVHQTFGSLTTDTSTVTQGTFRTYTFFASTTAPTFFATTTNATSTNITPFFDDTGTKDNGYFVIAGTKDVNVYFTRDTAGSGSSRFSIQVTATSTPVEADWYDYNRLSPNTVSSSANDSLTRVGTSTISATTGTNIFKMETLGFYAIRCIVVETTDGTHICRASASY